MCRYPWIEVTAEAGPPSHGVIPVCGKENALRAWGGPGGRMLRRIFQRTRRGVSESHPRRDEVSAGDTLIASFPRSGNTWLRLLLADAFLQRQGFATDTRLPVHQDQVIPDLDSPQDMEVHPGIQLPFRILKTHWPHQPFMKKTLFLFRRPTSCLSSYYHFQQRYPGRYPRTKRGIDAFCLKASTDWIMHAESFLRVQKKQSYSVKVIWYQHLWTEPAATLKDCLQWLDFDAGYDLCTRAVENHTFQKRRALESKPRYGQYFYRKGQLDSGRSELRASVYDRIARKAEPTFQALCRASSGGLAVEQPLAYGSL